MVKSESFGGLKTHKNNEVNVETIDMIIKRNKDKIMYMDIGGAVLNTSINMGYLGLENYILLSLGGKDNKLFYNNLKKIPNVVPLIQKNSKEDTGKVITFIPKTKNINNKLWNI
jgi:hypothetical protein